MNPLLRLITASPLRDRIVVLADNNDPTVFRFDSGHVHSGMILFGNPDLLEHYLYHAVHQKQKYVIETRLDADDGLPHDFIQTVQSEVQNHMRKPTEWVVLCTPNSWEWHLVSPVVSPNNKNVSSFRPFGVMRTHHGSKCISAGMTLAYGTNTTLLHLPKKVQYGRVQDETPPCPPNERDTSSRCTHQLYLEEPYAIRARTPTCTNMKGVGTLQLQPQNRGNNNSALLQGDGDGGDDGDDNTTAHLTVLEQEYGISPLALQETRTYIIQNLVKIAKNNLDGQCKPGHMCNEVTKRVLRPLTQA